MDAKRALEASGDDLESAEAALREKGLAQAAAKAGRATTEGIVECYVHAGSRIGAMVEVNCETDFVARTPEFKDLAHNLAMQVAAMAPLYLDEAGAPEDETRAPEEVCLLSQAFIRDPSRTVNDLVMDVRSRVGENVRVARFARFGLGE
ncbi:MAG: elongation factor Ts [Chloroflexota bacterium]|nr:elongation factor Ts [Chloroflexota bacterium]